MPNYDVGEEIRTRVRKRYKYFMRKKKKTCTYDVSKTDIGIEIEPIRTYRSLLIFQVHDFTRLDVYLSTRELS